MHALTETRIMRAAAAGVAATAPTAASLAQVESLSSFVELVFVEVMLGTKEVNERTRNASYALLIAIGEKAQKSEGVFNEDAFLSMILAGLGGDSPHMISAAVLSLARVAYEVRYFALCGPPSRCGCACCCVVVVTATAAVATQPVHCRAFSRYCAGRRVVSISLSLTPGVPGSSVPLDPLRGAS